MIRFIVLFAGIFFLTSNNINFAGQGWHLMIPPSLTSEVPLSKWITQDSYNTLEE
jgi:hypothetical protein